MNLVEWNGTVEWTTGVGHWTGLLECHAHKLVAYFGMPHNTESFQGLRAKDHSCLDLDE